MILKYIFHHLDELFRDNKHTHLKRPHPILLARMATTPIEVKSSYEIQLGVIINQMARVVKVYV